MDATTYRWDEIAEDNPIALLTRRTLYGEKMMVARVRLEKGCHVAPHHHDSEQIAIVMSGSCVWLMGEERTPVPMKGGEVMVLPSNVVHGLDVLEDTEIIDVLSPIGPMGVDKQGK